MTHGQDFSHMYAQPTIINVQIDEDEEQERRLEVSNCHCESVCTMASTCQLQV
jgi:hypothetical protein